MEIIDGKRLTKSVIIYLYGTYIVTGRVSWRGEKITDHIMTILKKNIKSTSIQSREKVVPGS